MNCLQGIFFEGETIFKIKILFAQSGIRVYGIRKFKQPASEEQVRENNDT